MVLMLIYYLYFVGGACLLLFALMLLALTECMTGLSYECVYFVFLLILYLHFSPPRVVDVKFRVAAL
jgi:hypothetical protein